eukprot:2916737-Pyramimonas_sp.AAC.1
MAAFAQIGIRCSCSFQEAPSACSAASQPAAPGARCASIPTRAPSPNNPIYSMRTVARHSSTDIPQARMAQSSL